jgi:hypothetical protein
MPNNVIESSRDEHKWKRAEQIAAKSGHKGDYAYIMGIYKRMKPDHQFKKSASERDWVRIAGDIIAHAAWDSEKVASAFNAELELIELEKMAAGPTHQLTRIFAGESVTSARALSRELAKLRSIATRAKGGAKFKPGSKPAKALQFLERNGGFSKLVADSRVQKALPSKSPFMAGNAAGPSASQVSKQVGAAQPKVQPKSTVFEASGGKKVDVPKQGPTEKVIQTPATKAAPTKTQTQAVADQTKAQAGQAQAAGEAAKKAPKTPQAQKTRAEISSAPGQMKSRIPETPVRWDTPRNLKPTPKSRIPETPVRWDTPRNLKPTPKTPASTVGKAGPQPAPKKQVSQAAADSFKQESTALARTSPTLNTLKGRAVPQKGLTPAETSGARDVVSTERAAVRTPETQAAVDKVRGNVQRAEDLSRVGLKPTIKERVTAVKDKANAGFQKAVDRRVVAGKQKGQARFAATAQRNTANQISGDIKKIDAQMRLAQSQGNYGALSQLAGQKQVLTNQLGKMGKPAPKTTFQQQAPKQTKTQTTPPPEPQPRMEPGPTPVQEAASQSPGFWQQAKSTWGGMSENQRLLAVGATGLGAGALANNKPQRPPMYGPAPQYQMAPQPMYR